MPFASFGSDRIHYEIDGSGPGLVLVHGAGGDAGKTFGATLPFFKDRYTVVRPNLSGSGHTADDGGELTVERLAGQVDAVTRDAGKAPVDMLGFSLGAFVAATAAAAEQPELVRRLILVGGAPHATGPRDVFNFAFWRDLLAADFALFERFAMLQGFSPALLNDFGHEGLAASLGGQWPPGLSRQVALPLPDIRDLLPKIEVPALVIGFGADQMFPIEGARQLHAMIPDSRFAEVPDAGHLDFCVRPELVVQLISEFLDEELGTG